MTTSPTTRPAVRSLALAALVAALLAGPFALAQEVRPKLTLDVALEGQGGVAFKAPAWKEAKKEADLGVWEHVAPAEVAVLVVAAEKGPEAGKPVDWEAVRKNVVEAAEGAGGKLELTLGEPFAGAEGFEARRMKGRLTSGEQTLDVALVALVGAGRFVSVSVLTGPEGRDGAGLAGDVAATVKLAD